MIDYELLKLNIQRFIDILFPDFETCRSHYYDPNIDSDDSITKFTAMFLENAKYEIEKFDFKKYINETINKDNFNYISSFLPPKFQKTGELIFNTLAKKILTTAYKNENSIKQDKTLFPKIINEEVNLFIKLVKSFTEYNDYLFYSHNFIIDESLLGKYLTNEIIVKSTKEDPIFVLEKVDYNVRIYQTIKPFLIKALALIFNKKVDFFQFADTHTIKLENYGCKNISLYPINDISYFTSPYQKQLIPFGPKITIDGKNYDMVHNLLTPYMDTVRNLDKNDYKNVSLEFFLDSLDKYGTAKITYSIIAIEALFNVSRQEITKTVVQRGLKILQNYYTSEYWEQIEEDLKTAYIIRSYYAHGESRNQRNATIELSEKISEYARIILLTFLLISSKVTALRGKTGEKKYINEKLIDKSLFYPESNKTLYGILKDIPIYIKEFNKIIEAPSVSSEFRGF